MTQERLLKLTEVEKLVGFKKTWIYDEVKKGAFPAPIAIARSSRWRLSDINAWIDSCTRPTDGKGGQLMDTEKQDDKRIRSHHD